MSAVRVNFELKRKDVINLNDGYNSYVCGYSHIHDYSKIDLKELEKETKNNKTYKNAKEMMKDILKEENE